MQSKNRCAQDFEDHIIKLSFRSGVQVVPTEWCRKRKDLAYAKRVHAHIYNNGFETHRAVGNHIVPMFVECGSLSDAQQVFDRLIYRNEHSWTSIILGYIQCGQLHYALNLYQKMQEDGIHPSVFTLVPVLKACASLKHLRRGREIHTDIARKGIESDLVIGNTLISMYAKCGSLSEAQGVFEKLSVRDVVSWTALIAGYAEHGPGQTALRYFEQMQLRGISPNDVTFICILKACGSIRALEKGQEIHFNIICKGFERCSLIGNILIHMYAKCGSLLEARKVFDMLPIQEVVSWTTLIAGYAEYGPVQEALRCFEQMHQKGISPSAVTFVCILKACGTTRAIEKGRKIHMEITLKGFEIYPLVGNTLVDLYHKCGSLSEAQEVFDKLRKRDVVSWNALIAGYSDHGYGHEALKCFDQMRISGVCPNVATFICLLKACNMGAVVEGREIHREIKQRGFERDLFVGSALIDMFARCGLLLEAQEAFDNMPVKEVVLWTALIAVYANHGLGQEALKCFEQMQLEGIFPDDVTYVCALKACTSLDSVEKGRKIHVKIAHKGFIRDLSVGNTLLDMYAKCNSLPEAQEVFDKLPVREVVSWTVLIAGYAEHGLGQEALRCFEQMEVEGTFPDAATYVCALKACGCLGAIDKGQVIHTQIMRKGFERYPLVGNTLVDMYAKCGLVVEAQEVFDKLPVQDAVSWTALIAGYVLNHEENRALLCFEAMREQGVKPSAVTFTCLLTACSHANLVAKAQEYFKAMRGEYGIAPTIDHYTCIVDLLARSGRLYKAEKFLETITCPLSEGTWRSLLSGCKTYGEAEVGVRCFQQLVQMNPEDAFPYMVMADIYSTAGRWDDAYNIEELRKHTGAKKKPGSALIEVNKKVHEFVVGDNQRKEVSVLLEILGFRVKDKGHVPDLAMR